MKKHLSFALLFLLSFYCAAQFEGLFDWDKDGKDLVHAVKHAYIEAEQPRIMKINAVRIDAADKQIAFIATGADKDFGKPMPDFPSMTISTKRQKTRDFMRQCRKSPEEGGLGKKVILAVNASGFAPWTTPFNHTYATNMGFTISDGKVISESYKDRKNTSFIVYKDGKIDIAPLTEKDDISGIEYSIAAFTGVVLAEGKVTPTGKEPLHPRTAYGLSQDKRYVVFVTVDGRQKGYSEGATTAEMGELLRYFGCFKGINMDGGGSTTLAYWNDTENDAVQLNHHQNKAERRVGNSFGIYLKDAE